MTKSEQVCRVLIAHGKWNKNNCHLCRVINKSTCPILAEDRREKEFLENSKDYQPIQAGFVPDKI